jgi:hypothetical protein
MISDHGLHRFGSANPLEPADTKILDERLPDGGVILSTYLPQMATKWLEEHENDDLLSELRAHDFDGPLAFQLTPYETALAVLAHPVITSPEQFRKSEPFRDYL